MGLRWVSSRREQEPWDDSPEAELAREEAFRRETWRWLLEPQPDSVGFGVLAWCVVCGLVLGVPLGLLASEVLLRAIDGSACH